MLAGAGWVLEGVHCVIKPLVSIALAAAMLSSAAADTRTDGRRFFQQEVQPRLAENGCPLCHAVYYVRPRVLEYDELMPYLAMGDAPEKTAVIRKIANLRAFLPDRPTHPGGQRCRTLDAEPCRSIMRWWQVEFGAHRSTPAAAAASAGGAR